MRSSVLSSVLNFDIDHYLNPYIPRNHLDALPQPFRHFLGRRKEPHKEPPALIQWTSTFIATLGGLCLVGGLFNYAPGIARLNPPVMIASLGASAVLDYNTVRSPLAQPRNVILGHTLAALIGVCVSKLFQLNHAFFISDAWVAGAVACACASLVMSWTDAVHPPGGATAVLACTEAQIVGLGWWFVALVLLASVLMTTVACLLNNVVRQYPVYWWTPEATGQKLGRRQEESPDGNGLEKQVSSTESQRTLRREFTNDVVEITDDAEDVRIMPYKIQLPSYILFDDEEIDVLRRIEDRLQKHAEVGG